MQSSLIKFKIFEQNGSWEDIYKSLIQKKMKITVLCNINLSLFIAKKHFLLNS